MRHLSRGVFGSWVIGAYGATPRVPRMPARPSRVLALYGRDAKVARRRRPRRHGRCVMQSDSRTFRGELSNTQARDMASLLHPFTNLTTLRQTGPTVIQRGSGVFVYGEDGKDYLEAMGGLWCT